MSGINSIAQVGGNVPLDGRSLQFGIEIAITSVSVEADAIVAAKGLTVNRLLNGHFGEKDLRLRIGLDIGIITSGLNIEKQNIRRTTSAIIINGILGATTSPAMPRAMP